ncbi:MAG: alpha/beta fold hydrolase [Candidatus Solibacter usitatus]|nr:alpha/beta fold hydrolase [Candidatus Solibacter usitatus]
MRPFEPLVPNPHFLTVAGNYWPRALDTARFPANSRLYRTEPDVQVLVQSQRPPGPLRGEIVLVHGLEGSGESGYMRSLAQAGLEAGYAMHRFHMRTCGGTAHLCRTLYHAGLTSDLLAVLRQLESEAPVSLVGFSLGGNVVLKLAGELGDRAQGLIAAVCAVSTPIDLAACARRIGRIDNRIYERRFLRRMFARLLATGRYQEADFRGIRSIYEIDDRVTAPSFGFRGADHYYATQSSHQFLERIRVPALLIQARDDTFIPFDIFRHPAFDANPCLRLLAPKRGGHVGFIARSAPRFWVDGVVLEWMEGLASTASQSLREDCRA